jgi:sortase (surface protein transpeptidase)
MHGGTDRRHRLALRLVVSAFTVLLMAGCGQATQTVPGAASAATSAPAPDSSASDLGASRPVRLLIPSIKVDTALMDLGLRPDGTMEVPPDGKLAGWYTDSPTPGEIGPAVLAAHVDWKGAEGVFFFLSKTKPGDRVVVKREDGSTAAFVVDRVEQYPKDNFPTDAVYGNVDSAQLRLITCGGDFDASAHSYRDNIVVYADLVS